MSTSPPFGPNVFGGIGTPHASLSKSGRKCAAALGLVAAALGAGRAVGQAGGAEPPQPDRLIYTTFAPANLDVYLFENAGEKPRQIAAHPALDYDAVQSPDGRWVVFCSERGGDPDLFVLDLERGGEPRALIDSDALEDQAAFAPDGRSIAFVSTASGNTEVYTLPFTPERTVPIRAARNVTNHPGNDFRPAFAPDGRALAFSSDRDLPIRVQSPAAITRIRSGDIYTVDLASLQTRRLTDAPGWDGSPAWSPNGNTIAFYSERGRPLDALMRASLWLMDADGSNQRALEVGEIGGALSPQFLPNGRIVFARRLKPLTRDSQFDEAGTWHLASVNAAGSDLRIESDDGAGNYWQPAPGPRGRLVAYGAAPDPSAGGPEPHVAGGAPFLLARADRAVNLYPLRASLGAVLHPRELLLLQSQRGTDLTVSTLDGDNAHRVLDFGMPRNRRIGFSWSRDGEWIAFSRGGASAMFNGPTDGDVFKIRPDGTQLANLTLDSSADDDGYPSFSSNGEWIVFRSGRGGLYELYLMRTDGSQRRQLTQDGANALFPAFSPTVNRIAFLSNRAEPGSMLYDVYLADLNADLTLGAVHRVTATDGQEGHVAFSPDGRWLVFTSEQAGIVDETPLYPQPQAYGEMYAYRIEDGATIRLTHNKWEEGVPSWERAARPIAGR